MKLAFIDQGSGEVTAIFTPEVHLAPWSAQSGVSLLILDGYPEIYALPDQDIIAHKKFDFQTMQFVDKE